MDMDATLAVYDRSLGPLEFGPPIPAMAARVKQWLEDGREVRIVTARVAQTACVDSEIDHVISHHARYGRELTRYEAAAEILEWNRLIPQIKKAIGDWTLEHLGHRLEATAQKDFRMECLWDDRVVRVVPNTGERCCGG